MHESSVQMTRPYRLCLLGLLLIGSSCTLQQTGDVPGLTPSRPSAIRASYQYPISVGVHSFADSRVTEHNVTSGTAVAQAVTEYLTATQVFSRVTLRTATSNSDQVSVSGEILALDWSEKTLGAVVTGGMDSCFVTVTGEFNWRITDQANNVLCETHRVIEKKGTRDIKKNVGGRLPVLNQLYSEVYQQLCEAILEDINNHDSALTRIAQAVPVQAPTLAAPAAVANAAPRVLMPPPVQGEMGWAISPGIRPPEKALPSPKTSSVRQYESWKALLIGINHYRLQDFPPLETPTNDVGELARILRNNYGFQVKTLLDQEATVTNTKEALIELSKTITTDDNLLIYFAGHGNLDDGGVGSWLLYDSQNALEGMENSEVKTRLDKIKARRILLIADSCYSGSLVTRGDRALAPVKSGQLVTDNVEAARISTQLLTNKRPSREAITSGSLHPVADKGTGFCQDHSPFACTLTEALRNVPAQGVLSTRELYRDLYDTDARRRKAAGQPVQGNGPQLTFLEGHDNGEFLFVRVK